MDQKSRGDRPRIEAGMIQFRILRGSMIRNHAHSPCYSFLEYTSWEIFVQRICVDMDEVMADTLAEHLRRYNQTFDEELTPHDLVGKGLWEIAPLDRQAQLRAFLDAEDFFEDLALMPDAQMVLKELSARYEIFIATQAMTV